MMKRILYLALPAALLLSGCAEEVEPQETPGLSKPIAIGESYMPVRLGDIGVPRVIKGSVQYVEYGQSYNTNITVKELAVSVGDQVEVGDVLAYADLTEKQNELASLEKSLQDEHDTYTANETIYLNQFENSKSSDPKVLAMDTALYQEDYNYRAKLHEERVNDITARIEGVKADIELGTLRATHAGQVVYVKNLNRTGNASATENIVVICDKSQKVIKLEENMDGAKNLQTKTERYIYRNGQKVKLEEIAYSGSELVLSKMYGTSPSMLFTCDAIDEMKSGDTVNAYFIDETKVGLPVIAKDSVYGDEEKYVYVLKDGNREKRNVVLGGSYGYYIEVKEGLELGELVAFSSEEPIPTGELSYTVQVSNLNITNNAYVYFPSESDSFSYKSEYEGKVVELSPSYTRGVEVNEGDYLYTIDTGERGAAVRESYYRLEDAKTAREEMLKRYDEQMVENYKAYLESSDEAFRTYIVRENQNLELQMNLENRQCLDTIDQLTKDYEAKNYHDGTGLVKVYAKNSGTIEKLGIALGDKIAEGSDTYTLSFQKGSDVRVELKSYPQGVQNPPHQNPENKADIDERVTISYGGKNIQGTCIGYYGYGQDLQMPYLFTDEVNNAHITFNSDTGFSYNGFYLRLDDENNLDSMMQVAGSAGRVTVKFPEVNIEQAIILPSTSMVHGDYVWVERDGYIFRQYIVVDTDYADLIKGVVVLAGLEPGDKVVY